VAPDLVRKLRLVGGKAAAAFQQVRLHLNDRQNVVEIVRHAAGQLADALHFLGLAELFFQLFAFEERPDLPSNAEKHFQHFFIRRAYLLSKKIHHADDFAFQNDGKGQRAPQPDLDGQWRARIIIIIGDIWD
jgi:hypothetical protein